MFQLLQQVRGLTFNEEKSLKKAAQSLTGVTDSKESHFVHYKSGKLTSEFLLQPHVPPLDLFWCSKM